MSTFYEVWATSLFSEDYYVGYGFTDKQESTDFVNKYNVGRDYEMGDEILFIVPKNTENEEK